MRTGKALWGLRSSGVPTQVLIPSHLLSPPALQHQGFQVQLESVKKLRDLEEQRGAEPNPSRVSRLRAQRLVPSVCYHPALPPDLQPICTSKEAASVLQALSEYPHPCGASCQPTPASSPPPHLRHFMFFLVSTQCLGQGESKSSASGLPCLGTASQICQEPLGPSTPDR